MSYSEQEIYNELWLSVQGNGTVHFDSDSLDEEEGWIRYFSRIFYRIQEKGLVRAELLMGYHVISPKSGLCQVCHEEPPCSILASLGLTNKELS